jgi:hypothetical protein
VIRLWIPQKREGQTIFEISIPVYPDFHRPSFRRFDHINGNSFIFIIKSKAKATWSLAPAVPLVIKQERPWLSKITSQMMRSQGMNPQLLVFISPFVFAQLNR